MFTQPLWLVLMVVPLGLTVWYVIINKRKKVDTVTFSNPAFMTDVIKPYRPSRRWIAFGLLMLTLFGLPFAMARPTFTSSTPESRNTVMIVLDVSTSMDATDVSPSRLEAAKAAIAAAVKDAPSSLNIGLVTLADHAQSVATPSLDHAELLSKLAKLKSQKGGTASGEGVLMAIDSLNFVRAFGGEATSFNGRIILVSDGVEEISSGEQNLQAATAESKKLAYAIDTVSYGTPNGTLNGQPIQVDPDSLKAASAATGGSAITADNGQKLQAALDTIQNSAGSTQKLQTLPDVVAWGALVLFCIIALAVLFGFILEKRR